MKTLMNTSRVTKRFTFAAVKLLWVYRDGTCVVETMTGVILRGVEKSSLITAEEYSALRLVDKLRDSRLGYKKKDN